MAFAWCVYCHGVIPDEAGTCQYCRKKLTPGSRVVQCKACNGFVLQSETICKHCGKKLPSIEERKENARKEMEKEYRQKRDSGEIYSRKPTIHCPKCGSSDITMMRKGFSFGKAAVGVWALGPVGAVAGLASNKYVRVCMRCKNKF